MNLATTEATERIFMLYNYYRPRVLLVLGSAIAFACFWYTATLLAFPRFAGKSVSLLAGTPNVSMTIAAAVVCVIATLLAVPIVGRIRFDAPLFCAAAGMSALSLRGGTITYVLFEADSPRAYAMLIVETWLLFGFLIASWWVLTRMGGMRSLICAPDITDPDEKLTDRLLTVVIHSCMTATLMVFLCRSDDKAQALGTVGVSAFLASLASGALSRTRPSIWYWISPLLVATVGYLWAMKWNHSIPIGQTRGYFAALARPLPLDYASAGTVGALAGYWIAQTWRKATPVESNEEAVAPQ